jgi:hypothetical protein
VTRSVGLLLQHGMCFGCEGMWDRMRTTAAVRASAIASDRKRRVARVHHVELQESGRSAGDARGVGPRVHRRLAAGDVGGVVEPFVDDCRLSTVFGGRDFGDLGRLMQPVDVGPQLEAESRSALKSAAGA